MAHTGPASFTTETKRPRCYPLSRSERNALSKLDEANRQCIALRHELTHIDAKLEELQRLELDQLDQADKQAATFAAASAAASHDPPQPPQQQQPQQPQLPPQPPEPPERFDLGDDDALRAELAALDLMVRWFTSQSRPSNPQLQSVRARAR